MDKNYDISSKLSNRNSKVHSYLVPSNQMLIAAPHHADQNNDLRKMRNAKGNLRTYDANVGYIALEVARLLNTSYLICNNAKKDPNKFADSTYCKAVKKIKPYFLIEIHGHSGNNVPGKSISPIKIEVSGGKNSYYHAIDFAMYLRQAMVEADMLGFEVEGRLEDMFYKASKTLTVNGEVHNHNTTNRTLHIELPALLRRREMVDIVAKIIANALQNFS